MTPVKKSVYADYFSCDACLKAALLDKVEAGDAFESVFGTDSKILFDLPDNHWLVKAECKAIGEWLEAYNRNENEAVSNVLRKAVDWSETDSVFYLVKKSTVFEVPWGEFIQSWALFLACEDDATIVMRDLMGNEGLMFTSIGEIRHFVGRR